MRLSETIKRKTKKQRQQSGVEGWASKTFKPENTQKIQKVAADENERSGCQNTPI